MLGQLITVSTLVFRSDEVYYFQILIATVVQSYMYIFYTTNTSSSKQHVKDWLQIKSVDHNFAPYLS